MLDKGMSRDFVFSWFKHCSSNSFSRLDLRGAWQSPS